MPQRSPSTRANVRTRPQSGTASGFSWPTAPVEAPTHTYSAFTPHVAQPSHQGSYTANMLPAAGQRAAAPVYVDPNLAALQLVEREREQERFVLQRAAGAFPNVGAAPGMYATPMPNMPGATTVALAPYSPHGAQAAWQILGGETIAFEAFGWKLVKNFALLLVFAVALLVALDWTNAIVGALAAVGGIGVLAACVARDAMLFVNAEANDAARAQAANSQPGVRS